MMHTYYAHILAYLVFALCTWKLKEIIFPSDLWDTEGFISKFGLLLIREGARRQFSEGGRTVRNRMILSATPPLKFKPSWKHCFKGALCFWLLLANTDCVILSKVEEFPSLVNGQLLVLESLGENTYSTHGV